MKKYRFKKKNRNVLLTDGYADGRQVVNLEGTLHLTKLQRLLPSTVLILVPPKQVLINFKPHQSKISTIKSHCL